MARHITRKELGEAKRLGAWRRLYRGARRAGASHQEILSVLQSEQYLWKYEMARRVGDNHQEALAFLESGMSPFDYQELRRAGAAQSEILEVNGEDVDLRFYAMARRLGVQREDAALLVKAGLFHASDSAWRKAADALRDLRAQELETPGAVERVAKLAPDFEGDAQALAHEAVTTTETAKEPIPHRAEQAA